MRASTKHPAGMVSGGVRDTFWRTLQTFSVTRIVITLVLLAYLGINTLKSSSRLVILVDWPTCIAYLFIATGFFLLSVYAQKRLTTQLLSQVAVDIFAISLLYIAAGGDKSGLAILYLFPLAGCAILAPTVLALFFAAVVTLIMLGESGYQLFYATAEASPSRAGLYGAAFFAAVYMINRLAAKLIKQEDLAAQRGHDLQLQEAINRLIIADMGDGVLVVDPDTKVITGNPAVERMLGLSVAYGQLGYKLTDMPSLRPIAEAFSNWRLRSEQGGLSDPHGASFVVIKHGDDIVTLQGSSAQRESRRELALHLKLRFARVDTAGLKESRAVIFLQDVSEIENKAQQLKLASMGRLTASIAHEVRNPLSAISHAASLLSEDITHPTQSRLLNIVKDNALRMNRMVEDILKLSRKANVHGEPLKLAFFFDEVLAEFKETHAVAPNMIVLGKMKQYKINFDPLHLREVVFNLLSNALRYASGRAGSIQIHLLAPKPGILELHVQDDGPPITPQVRAHLFEPFYTTSSKGTGLGLYVARELCLNNGAMLDYEYRMDVLSSGDNRPNGRFVITFATSEPL